jgi:hypothetical protein
MMRHRIRREIANMAQVKLLRIVVAFLLAGALGGCVASQNPVGPENEAVSEPRLAGAWQYVGDRRGAWDYLHVIPSEDGKTLEIVATNAEERAWAVLAGHVTAIGERRYVSLRLTTASAKLMADLEKQGSREKHPYSFVAYRFDGDDSLAVAYPLKPMRDAVKEGRLAGKMEGDYDVVIDDSSANIAAVLGTVADADLFGDPVTYRRIAAAPSP